MYQIDPLSGAATFLSLQSTLPGAGDVPTGSSFDPIDLFRARYVNTNDENARFSAGVFVDDPDLNPSGAQISAAAYAFDFPRIDRGPPVPATLDGIFRATNSLVTIGGVNGLAGGALERRNRANAAAGSTPQAVAQARGEFRRPHHQLPVQLRQLLHRQRRHRQHGRRWW